MLRTAILPALLALSACGQSNEDALQDAANQSGPVAAAVLNNAAENGVDPQAALEAAGEAQVEADAEPEQRSLQARPNLPSSPNRPEGGEPPAKVESTTSAEDEHAGHNME